MMALHLWCIGSHKNNVGNHKAARCQLQEVAIAPGAGYKRPASRNPLQPVRADIPAAVRVSQKERVSVGF